jgi:hypothetical protein
MRQLTRLYVTELILEHQSIKNLRCMLRTLLPAIRHVNVTVFSDYSNNRSSIDLLCTLKLCFEPLTTVSYK